MSKSRIVPAIRVGNALVSKRVMGPMPLMPSRTLSSLGNGVADGRNDAEAGDDDAPLVTARTPSSKAKVRMRLPKTRQDC